MAASGGGTGSRQGSASGPLAGFRVHAVVPAAGRGERFGEERPKQFAEIAGRPLLVWTVHRLLSAGCASLTLALPADRMGELAELAGDARIRRVEGGATRQASVASALEASPAARTDLVAVHDGARPATSARDLLAVVEAAERTGGAVLGRAVSDTVKRLEGWRIAGTIDRRTLFRAETPQVFRRDTLERAIARARADRFAGTDEASLVERLGELPIAAVESADPNPKVTVPSDLPLVEWLLARLAAEGGA
jgi:2-C-methyl-D-erythritol 4-phosphate cytidylyltransferase